MAFITFRTNLDGLTLPKNQTSSNFPVPAKGTLVRCFTVKNKPITLEVVDVYITPEMHYEIELHAPKQLLQNRTLSEWIKHYLE